jgi:FkbH-like protein
MDNSEKIAVVRAEYLKAVETKDTAAALYHAGALLELSPTLGIAQQIIKTLPAELPGRATINLRVAFLRSFTVEPILPLLKAYARLFGIDLTIKVGEFNSYAQEIIDPSSWLYQFDPQIVILAVQTRDVAPDVWYGSTDESADGITSVVDRLVSPVVSLIGHLRQHSQASLILQTFEQPVVENGGLLDSRRTIGQAELIRQMNRELNASALDHTGVYVLDYDALIARHGRMRWTDEKKWVTSRSPISADHLVYMAKEYLRYIVPLAGRQSKVLVVDLDNTLWGGVVGEEGVNGIKIGPEYPGSSYLALQRAILDLYDRGILLAICSKNNEADALEALVNRSEMLLRPSHFAAFRINWTDKAQNLREIALELNVGIDSLSFIDDNPVERQRVKRELPEVTVIDLPEDPSGYAQALRASPVFERLTITSEDRDRGRIYAEQRERKQLETSAGSIEDFYRSLEMTAEFVAVGPESIARIAQLTQKTNQLNMTTRRYTENDMQTLADSSDWRIFGIKVVDKFGDNGLVGVVLLHILDQSVEIDTFLLSCRVIGRTVETAMLAYVTDIARQTGRHLVEGWFLPTKKNDPAKDIYANHGFIVTRKTDDDLLWQLDLTEKSITRPEWIK